MQLDSATHEALLHLSWELSSLEEPRALLRESSLASIRFVPADTFGVTEMNLGTGEIDLQIFPDEHLATLANSRLASIADQHPAINAYKESRSLLPTRMSDLVEPRVFEATATYCELFEPFDFRFQLNVPIYLDADTLSGAALAFNRKAYDFSQEEIGRACMFQAVSVALMSALTAKKFDPQRAELAARNMRLTPRELQILELIMSGMTSQSAARALRISFRTVNKHLENAYRKLDVRSRLEASAKCRVLGLTR